MPRRTRKPQRALDRARPIVTQELPVSTDEETQRARLIMAPACIAQETLNSLAASQGNRKKRRSTEIAMSRPTSALERRAPLVSDHLGGGN